MSNPLKKLLQPLYRYNEYRRVCGTIHTYCMFIGYPRSGHTLVRSLLDAHPNAVIANEEHVLGHVADGTTSRFTLYTRILENTRTQAQRRNEWTGYSYHVPGGRQGTYTTLHVIGDKKGGESARLLHKKPYLTETLKRIVQVPLRTVHCIRNPYNNIASMAVRSNRSIEAVLEEYRERVAFITDWRKKRVYGKHYLDVYHEALIEQPEKTLSELLAFLTLPESKEYSTHAKRIIFTEPRMHAAEVSWKKSEIQEIEHLIATTPFLSRYATEH